MVTELRSHLRVTVWFVQNLLSFSWRGNRPVCATVHFLVDVTSRKALVERVHPTRSEQSQRGDAALWSSVFFLQHPAYATDSSLLKVANQPLQLSRPYLVLQGIQP